jgi:hypothetical protein
MLLCNVERTVNTSIAVKIESCDQRRANRLGRIAGMRLRNQTGTGG